MPADPNYPQAAPYVDGAPAQQGYGGTPLYDKPSNSFDAREDEDDKRILDDAVSKGAEIVAGQVSLDGKTLGFLEFGKFKPNPAGRNWAKAQEENVEPVDTNSPIASQYDPADHEGPAPEGKVSMEKAWATQAAIDEANSLSDEERAVVESNAQATKTAPKKKEAPAAPTRA